MALLDRLKGKRFDLPWRKREERKFGREDAAKVREKPGAEDKQQKALRPGTLRIDEAREGGEEHGAVVLRPRITEKASFITEEGAYTFDVAPRANKVQVRKAIKEIYGVAPRKVNVVPIPAKRVMVRNRPGVKAGGKKAVVYLKEGDRIEFV